jgi:AAA15 family ATPase/GTPase
LSQWGFQVIEKIRVKNFRSFKDLELNLGNLNIVIGANASGKSNFVQIFKFLRDITIHGLENEMGLADLFVDNLLEV